mmetsp:Transcript_6624/g.12189  ORF Transcript_6624/g.12189 Transcript_6624/m.12189 type:complete len:316 (-) Transcript_6624:275-1222(-)
MRECRVELQLAQEQIKNLYTFKLLLLGAGESGKSTILKQIKLINRWEPSALDKEEVARGLKINIFDCLQNLLEQSRKFEYKMDPDDEETRKQILRITDDCEDFLNPETAKKIRKLLDTDAVKSTLARKNEFWLLESFDYLMESLERIADPAFEPTEDDLVMARVRTTGIVKTNFDHKVVEEPKVVHFEVVDVGGQRSERKKWIHCFDNVNAIMFVNNLAGYNKRLFEDQSGNRMQESLDLFESVVNNPSFKDIPIYLIMNKKDLFEQQVHTGDVRQYFGEFDGDVKDTREVSYFTVVISRILLGRESFELNLTCK